MRVASTIYMADSSSIYLLLFFCCGAIIWLYLKLRESRKRNDSLIIVNNKISEHNKQLTRANSQLVADNALLEAEQLKFQLQPHTLGNVVSTLNAIAKNLHRGTESLAESLNYILYKGNSHLVSVEDEVGFIRKYIQLNQLLYSDIISVNLDDSQVDSNSRHYKQHCIPHLISAYLIENAYKHGDKAHPEFLKIKVVLIEDKFEIIVINKVNPKPAQNVSGGIGLKNMEKRLALLFGNKFRIEKTSDASVYSTTLTLTLDNGQA